MGLVKRSVISTSAPSASSVLGCTGQGDCAGPYQPQRLRCVHIRYTTKGNAIKKTQGSTKLLSTPSVQLLARMESFFFILGMRPPEPCSADDGQYDS